MKSAIPFLILLTATTFAHGEGVRYSDPEVHYSIKFPEGWRRLPPEVSRRAAEAFVRQTGHSFPPFEAWFQRSDGPDGAYPYLLISRQICDMPTLDKLAADLGRHARAAAERADDRLGGLVHAFKIAEPVIDTHRKMVFIKTEQTVDLNDTGNVKGTICLFPGQAGVAQLAFYTTAEDIGRTKADFDFILDSLSFEPSYGYKARLAANSPQAEFNPDRVLMFALIGGALGMLCYGLLRRKNPNSTPGLLRLQVFFALLIVLSGLELIIHTPSGPISLTLIVGGTIVGVSGLVILWSRGRKESCVSLVKTPTEGPPSAGRDKGRNQDRLSPR